MESRRLETGEVLGERYEILEAVGKGGMGAVYRARDRRLDTVVAVKEMLDRADGPEERDAAVRQFQREARLLAQLSHRNLPRVTDYFVEGDRCYLVMEFVHGKTLDSVLRENEGRALPLMDALDYGIQLAEVLEYLHGQDPPIVFRDMKPSNIMLEEDRRVKLIDFGIARRFQSGQTKDTLQYGSPGYSPPEQYGRAQTDPRSDLYALGATLHHLVTGRDPSATPFKYPPIRQIDPSLPLQLEVFLNRCLEMQEEKRCQSAEEALETLRSVRADAQRQAAAQAAGQARAAAAPAARPPKVTSRHLQRARTVRALRQGAAAACVVAALGLVSALALRHAGSAPAKHGSKAHITNEAPPTPSAPAPAPHGDPGPLAPGQPVQPASSPPVLAVQTVPPGARTSVDGTAYGSTPTEIPGLGAGPHILRLDPPSGSGYAVTIQGVNMQSNGRTTVQATLSEAPAAASAPAATVARVDALALPATETLPARIRFYLTMHVAGAANKHCTVSLFFYSGDGASALRPAMQTDRFVNAEGQLTVTDTLPADAEAVDFTRYPLSAEVPLALFTVSPDQVAYRAAVYADGTAIGMSGLHPLQAGGMPASGSSSAQQ